jgi:hypothetical protein
MSALTASQAVFTTAGKALTSNAITGTGNVVMSASPTLTGTISAAAATLSGNLTLSGGTANGVLYLDGSKVAASGSALTFDGTSLAIGAGAPTNLLTLLATSTPGIDFLNGAGTKRAVISASSSALNFNSLTTNPITWQIDSSEQMRLTSTGLGIGTSSPKIQEWRAGTYLTVANASTRGQIEIDGAVADSGSANLGALIFTYSTNTTNHKDVAVIEAVSSGTTANQRGGGLNFYTKANGTASPVSNMTLDSSGNLGLGVTPSAWGGSYKGLQVAATGVFASNGSNGTTLAHNAYYDGTNDRYLTTGAASRVFQFMGGIRFDLAPSGTAGNAITFTQAMTLDASGRLGIGSTSPTELLTLASSNNFPFIHWNDSSNTNIAYMGWHGGSGGVDDLRLGTTTTKPITFYTNNTERARITSGGDLLVGTQTAGAKGIKVGSQYGGVDLAGGGGSYANWGGSYGIWPWNNVGLGVGSAASIGFVVNGGTEAARITSGGDLLVGTTSQIGTEKFGVDSGSSPCGKFKGGNASNVTIDAWNPATSGDNIFVAFRTETAETTRGTISYNRVGGLVAYNTTSDYRAKDILGSVTDSGATIDALKVYEGKMKGATQSRPMLVAHEAQEVAPYAVTGEKDAVDDDGNPKYQQMDVSSFVPLLIAEIQSLRQRVAQLEGTQP